METKIDPEISKHLEGGLTFLDMSGAIIRKDHGVMNWAKTVFLVYAFTTTPLFEVIDILHQEGQDLISALAFHVCTIPVILITATMILQWYNSKNSLIQSMVRVRENQLLIGEADGKLLETILNEFNLKRKIIIIFVWCVLAIIFCGLIEWLFAFNLTTFKMEYNEAMIKKYPFPLAMWFAMNYTKTKTTYLLTGTFAACTYLVLANCTIGVMALFYSLTTFGTIHFMILNNFLKTMHKRTARKLTRVNSTFRRQEYNNTMKEELRKCVIYLQEILSYCDLIEKAYSFVLLLEAICSCSLITGSLALIINTPKSDSKFISYFPIFAACLGQTFLFCYFGDRLTQEAGSVADALYFNKWLDLDKSLKKSMLIVMTRMSKPVTITMGKVTPVKLTTFIQIARAAYSFMALLRNSNGAVKG